MGGGPSSILIIILIISIILFFFLTKDQFNDLEHFDLSYQVKP